MEDEEDRKGHSGTRDDSIFGGMLHKIQRKFMINHSRHILEFTHLIKGRLQQGHCLLILLFLSLLKHSL